MRKKNHTDRDTSAVIDGPPVQGETAEGAAAMTPAGESYYVPPAGPTGNGDRPAKPVESKADKFRRLANRRVPQALKRIQHIASLANRAQYEFTPEQAAKIVDALKTAVRDLEQRYNGGAKAAPAWSL